MNPQDLENLMNWIADQVHSHDFGEIHVTIKLRDGKAAIVQRAFQENILLTSGKSGGGQDETFRR